MSFVEILQITLMFLLPIFAGSFKDRFASYLARTLIRLGSPTFSSAYLLYVTNNATAKYFADMDYDLQISITYSSLMLSLFGITWYISYRLVNVGAKIGEKEQFGMHYDSKIITDTVKQEIIPIKELLNKIQDGIGDMIACQQEWNEKQLQIATSYQKQRTEQHKEKQMYQHYIDKLLQIKDLYEILLSRIESMNFKRNNTKEHDRESFEKTNLTTEDGIANRTIGHKHQDDMAAFLRKAGFKVEDQHGTGKPDYILRTKHDSTIIAIGSNKSYSLYDEPKRMQRRITTKDCHPELVLAKKLQVPMVLFVTNKRNNRRWMKIIPPPDLDGWNGESTPVILAKDDDDSNDVLEEGFSNNIVNLGGEA